jgi:Glycosyl hydrolases family 25
MVSLSLIAHHHRRSLLAFAALCLTCIAMLGISASPSVAQTTATPEPPTTPPETACPQAANGQGTPGACSPKQQLGLLDPNSPAEARGPTFPDLSNNNPIFNMAPVRRHGHRALMAKVNQGTRFIDQTYARMIASARANGMVVGGYDFVQDYSIAEAATFIARLKATNTCAGRGVLPPMLDVEYGNFSYAGLGAMINAVRRACGRVQIYTGSWYWTPHAGCRWPAGVFAVLSGYPNAPQPCGLPTALYRVHQYTDHGFNGVSNSDMNEFRGSLAQLLKYAGL